jgi:hypothetical protein
MLEVESWISQKYEEIRIDPIPLTILYINIHHPENLGTRTGFVHELAAHLRQ